MVEKRRRFAKEFKLESVRLIVEEGRRISELSRELGVSENLLRNWKRKSEEGKIDPFPGKGRLSPEDDELRRLRRDNERLRIERDILKKQWPSSQWNRNEVHIHTGSPRIIFSQFIVPDSGSG